MSRAFQKTLDSPFTRVQRRFQTGYEHFYTASISYKLLARRVILDRLFAQRFVANLEKAKRFLISRTVGRPRLRYDSNVQTLDADISELGNNDSNKFVLHTSVKYLNYNLIFTAIRFVFNL